MSVFRKYMNTKHKPKGSDASWVYMESLGLDTMDSTTTNGINTIQMPSGDKPSNGTSSNLPSNFPDVDDHPSKGLCRKGGALRENALTIATFLSVVIGIAIGFGLREYRAWTKREIMYINFIGEVFLRMLKCLILPLIVSSLVSALGSLDTKLSGKIGIRAVSFYMATTFLAIVLGIILVVSIQPGVGQTADVKKDKTPNPSLTEDTLMDLVRNMFPPNIIEACTGQYKTVLIRPEVKQETNDTDTISENQNATNVTKPTDDYKSWKWEGEMSGGINILGLVVFSVVLGITLGKMKRAGKPLLDVFVSLGDAMMIITKCVIWLSPVGVFFLVMSKILEIDDLQKIASQLGMYSITVILGLIIHGFVTLPLIYFILLRKNPFTFMVRMGQALATAFGTSSSSATLPVTINCLEEKNFIDSRVARFCVPIGATINMDGTALYEAVAAIFIAQVREVPMSWGSIIAISITATAASIGAAGIPQAGLVTMVMVLNVVGLPAEDVTLILVVDWFLDRLRTTINVLGDAYGSGIVAHFSVKDLADMPSFNTSVAETTTL